MPKRESPADRRARSRRELADTTFRLALTADIDTISVDAIAELAGSSRSTFFRHFPTKYDALLHYLDAGLEVLTAEAARLLPAGPTWSALRTAAVASLRDLLSYPEPMRELIQLVQGHPGLLAAALLREDAARRTVTELLAAAEVSEPELVAGAAFAAIAAARDGWLGDPGLREPGVDLVRLTIGHFDRLAGVFDQ